MIAVVVRLGRLTVGLGMMEIGLVAALVDASPGGRLLVLLGGTPLVVAGSAGFMTPLLGRSKGSNDA